LRGLAEALLISYDTPTTYIDAKLYADLLEIVQWHINMDGGSRCGCVRQFLQAIKLCNILEYIIIYGYIIAYTLYGLG
jgi:hypothetical protein